MTGEDLKARRNALGLSRPALAALAGVHPDTVKYWEGRPALDLNGWAPKRLLRALGLGDLSGRHGFSPACLRVQSGNFDTTTRARYGVLGKAETCVKLCNARTRKGTPCRAKALPGKTRCKFHGGMSTGPKTPEGRERIAEAQRRRWAKWRNKSD